MTTAFPKLTDETIGAFDPTVVLKGERRRTNAKMVQLGFAEQRSMLR
jgi:hypothetical protein